MAVSGTVEITYNPATGEWDEIVTGIGWDNDYNNRNRVATTTYGHALLRVQAGTFIKVTEPTGRVREIENQVHLIQLQGVDNQPSAVLVMDDAQFLAWSGETDPNVD
jgi:hypothetical protein